ncbi:MAG: TetR/AcrR family transcriptional regulator [Spirochaetes bacterium]|nr:TetR/AcrR family transcriptional regulator [Spirochaetota bacterium]
MLQQGDGELSMRTLAAHLKVDPMALYHYFPDRDALWQAALEEVFQNLPTTPPARRRMARSFTFIAYGIPRACTPQFSPDAISHHTRRAAHTSD